MIMMIQSIFHNKSCLVFGCGNPLFGDDGFGPEVINYLESTGELPSHVACLDVGTSIRDILFNLLLDTNLPHILIIVDAVEVRGRRPGEIFEIRVDDIAPAKISDFSLHQFPTTNMLKEISEETPIDVRILVVQTSGLPTCVKPGLSKPVQAAVPRMAEKILNLIAEDTRRTLSGGFHD
jgi:coenzyme F420 hydrogenase subunit delta